ncbi:WGR domain-containing protein [Neorhizobium sp. P12A]|uniref:WGR domain-containing protein n=1 Tax=Neorhizobium sp. P12A TaxID=2268027 RepID=UPI001FF03F0C|nr:WGR domain-containing protein [Neorhizobium sp. P12A]
MGLGDFVCMSDHPDRLYWQRIDRAKNMARYYALAIQPTLFGEVAVVRCWGRIGKGGGEKSDIFNTEREAAAHFRALALKKSKKGYKPVGTCGKTAIGSDPETTNP